MNMIETSGLERRFGELTAVSDLNLQVNEGEVVGFLGPNGAGKTTTIRMLAGIIAPTAGSASIAGVPVQGAVAALHQKIGLLTESPGLYERLSAWRNLEFFAGFYEGVNVPAQVEKYLRLMGLWERRHERVGNYSRGMKQRLALARALLHEPSVLFLDEPTNGLDPEAARDVRRLITELRSEGRTIFLSTHNLGEAEQLCDRIAVFKTHLLAMDSPTQLRERLFRRRVTVRLDNIDSSLISAVQELGFVRQVERLDSMLSVELSDPEKNRPELVKAIVVAGGRVQGISEEEHSLEEVYLALMHEGNRI